MVNGQGAEARAYRLRFRKSGLARFLSHRDIMRVFRRAFRRAGLPLVLTRGFNPHPRIRVRPAAALGVVLHNAAVEIVLEREFFPKDLADLVSAALPAGIEIENARPLPALKSAPVATMLWRFPALEGGSLPLPPLSLPGQITLESESSGTILVSLRGLGGIEPPGARALATALTTHEDSPPHLRRAELVSIEFEDGV